MHVPDSLQGLIDIGLIDHVIRPLMSGKEAQVYLVHSEGEPRVAKVYKDAQNRSFKNRAMYTEGRRVRNSRRRRAMEKRTRYGRREEEAAWKSAEVDAIYKLAHAGVRVPQPFHFVDGVLVMEMIADAHGQPAPRLVDMEFDHKEARSVFHILIREVVRMLCAGLVHGDLSDFNVLFGQQGPVIIDFPQAVDAARNNNAKQLLIRDVKNLQSFLGRFDHKLKKARYAQEIWHLWDNGKLTPETPLTGRFKRRKEKVDTAAVLREIEAAEKEENARRAREGLEKLQNAKDTRRNREKAARMKRKIEKIEREANRPPPAKSEEVDFDDLDSLLFLD